MKDPNREFFYTDEFHMMNMLSKDLFYIIIQMSKGCYYIKKFDIFFEQDNVSETINGNKRLKTFNSFEEASIYCDLLGYKVITRQQVKITTLTNEAGYKYKRFTFI